RGNLVEQKAVRVDQEMVVRPRHARRDASVNQVGPSEQVDEAVARGEVKPGLPFRLAHPRRGHSRYSRCHCLPPMRKQDLKLAHTPQSTVKPTLQPSRM